MGNNTPETGSQNSRFSPVELAKAIVAIAAVPLLAYTIINNFTAQPGITVGIALFTAFGASVYMFRYQRTNIRDIIIAWLALIVIALGVFVLWPKTVTVQGMIVDTANNPVPNEEVNLRDINGVPRTTNTDNAGHYQFKDVPNGKYTITVRENRVEGLAQGGLIQVLTINLTISQPTPTPTPTPIPVPTATETPVPPTSTNNVPPQTETPAPATFTSTFTPISFPTSTATLIETPTRTRTPAVPCSQAKIVVPLATNSSGQTDRNAPIFWNPHGCIMEVHIHVNGSLNPVKKYVGAKSGTITLQDIPAGRVEVKIWEPGAPAPSYSIFVDLP